MRDWPQVSLLVPGILRGVNARERYGDTSAVLCVVHTFRSNTCRTDNRRTRRKMRGLELSLVLRQLHVDTHA